MVLSIRPTGTATNVPHPLGLDLPAKHFAQREERLRGRRVVAPAAAPIFQRELLLSLSHTLTSLARPLWIGGRRYVTFASS